MTTPDIYITDKDHAALVAALTALDRDPAHPHPLPDRIIEVLGEVGNIWPASINPDVLDASATTPGDRKAVKTYRDMLDMNAKALAKLEKLKPRT